MKLFKNNKDFGKCAKVFNLYPDLTSVENIVQSGEQAMVLLYGGSAQQDLHQLRVHQFINKLARRKTYVEP